jgi:ribosome biogenesis GTPase A
LAAGVARAEGVAAGQPAPVPPVIDAETWLAAAAERHTSGDTARMAQRLLDDFRRGVLGAIALELPG